MSEASNEATRPYDLETNNLCVFASYTNSEWAQSLNIVAEMEENGHNLISVPEEDEIRFLENFLERDVNDQHSDEEKK